MNKGFEAIEARWLFDVPMERVEIVMHRESIVHSLVEFCDGSVKAQLGEPDMRLPIRCALSYPERIECDTTPRLNLARTKALNFAEPELSRYPCLRLALEAGAKGGTWPAVLAASDEVAVEQFMGGEIRFTDIAKAVDAALCGARRRRRSFTRTDPRSRCVGAGVHEPSHAEGGRRR